MNKIMSYILRYGPLVAAFALGLAALISLWVPSYTGILNQILAVLSFVGVQPDQNIVAELGSAVAGVLALVGVARKLWSLIKPYFSPLP